jgi:hypothetical protein
MRVSGNSNGRNPLVGGVSDGDRTLNVATVADRVASYNAEFPDSLT